MAQNLKIDEPEVKQAFWPVVVLSISVIVLISLLLSYTLWLDHSSRINDSKNNTRFIANIVASQTRSMISELEKMLDGVAFEIRTQRLKVTPSLTEAAGEYLKSIAASNRNLMDVLILDANGVIVQWTGQGDPPSVTDRDYFRIHINNEKPALFIGEPLLSKVHKGQWFFAISKAMRDEVGKVENIVVAIVDIEYFHSQFADIELPPDSTLVLTRKSGKLIMRQPDHEKYVGSHLGEAAVIWMGGNSEGNHEIKSPVDQLYRIVGYKLLKEYGIGAYSSISRQAVLESWYNFVYIALIILISVLIELVLFSRRIHRAQKRVAEEQRKLASLARIDDLTGLYNRRHTLALFKAEFNRAKRYGTPLSLMMVDIDYFKSINDRYGHDCGDLTLARVANVMRHVCRGEAVTGRYGGEEFLIVLPSTAKEEAVTVAERLCKAVESETIDCDRESIGVTISVGVTSCDLDMEKDFSYGAVKKADEALYEAKGGGRNRVVAV